MKRYKYSVLSDIVKKFDKKKVVVIGDLLLDQFIWGEVSRISPEAPVPVVWVKDEGFMPGGACNVASNLTKFGAEVSLVGIVGDDEKAGILKGQLKGTGIKTDGIITDKTRPTVLKTRVIAHHQQVVRIDRERIDHVEGKYFKKIQDYLEENIKSFDGIIIEDYGKGIITPTLLKMVVPLAKKHKKIVAVDPKEDHFSYYKGVSVLTPNHHEAAKAVGFELKNEKSLIRGGEKLLRELRAKVVLITLGENGMMVFEKDKKPHKIPTLAQEVFDVSGAGDTVIAVYTLGIISGASPTLSAHIANCAAGIVVGKVGVAMVERKELLDRLKKEAERS
ncbi:MAG: D-glycero-beta-D-manno-heptose-7-phosphate kinase [Candidatus Omnitrophica bacterium]|nr:D-glycero-beta-D-manno-heptose-7-phosphate kinase [Candidatus Omnitrophota bacterium]